MGLITKRVLDVSAGYNERKTNNQLTVYCAITLTQKEIPMFYAIM